MASDATKTRAVSTTGGPRGGEYKVAILGALAVGKSAFTIQYFFKQFVAEYDPTVDDSYRKQVDIGDDSVLLDVLDTSGAEEFGAMIDAYLVTYKYYVLVYSITDAKSLDFLKERHAYICKAADKDRVVAVVVGNKCDLEAQRTVPTADGAAFAESIGAAFFEASAKTNLNVAEAFAEVLVRAREDKQKDKPVVARPPWWANCVLL